MKTIAKFEKISLMQRSQDFNEHYLDYSDIVLPKRATSGSAGYDFSLPYDIELLPGDELIINTGIRCRINEGFVLVIVPRSGLGFKYGVRLKNTVGVIDSDYYGAENEGHIKIKLVNSGITELNLKKGERFAQGILLPYYLAEEENVETKRKGGMGSTSV